MPPKKAPTKEAAPAVLEEKMFSIRVKYIYDASVSLSPPPKWKLRVISEFLPCCSTTEVFGKECLPFDTTSPREPQNDTNTAAAANAAASPVASHQHSPRDASAAVQKSASFRWEHDLALNTDEERKSFHDNPFLYAITLSDSGADEDSRISPESFAIIDCSPFILTAGTLSTRTEKVNGVHLELTVSCKQPLFPVEKAIPLEPVVLNLVNLVRFPLKSNETCQEAVESCYVYGSLDVGGGVQRQVFARPAAGSLEGSVSEYSPLAFSTVILPGYGSLTAFTQTLQTSTFVLELHKEDLRKRVFHSRNVAEYKQLTGETSRVEAAAASATTAAAAANGGEKEKGGGKGGGKGGKAAGGGGGGGKASAKGGPSATDDQPASPCEPTTDIDRFLMTCIRHALSVGSKINLFGSVRFRLEQLLSSSADLLREFAKRRELEQNGKDRLPKDETVVVKEEMDVEVRLQKPSKPEPWTMPTNFSLRAALQEAKNLEQTKIEGVAGLTSGTTGLSGTLKRHQTEQESHFRFIDCQTLVEITAELHRKLVHPTQEASVLAVPPLAAPPIAAAPVTTGRGADGVESARRRKSAEGKLTASPEEQERLAVIAAINKRLRDTPFTRMVFVFRYKDDATLLAINAAIAKVNAAALPDIQGSLRSYSFSEKEIAAANSGELDVVTGFSIIDDDVRIVVLEGLAGIGKGMQSVFIDLPRTNVDDGSYKFLCNPNILFSNRIYASFGPDLKRIRVRDTLKKLSRRPELYNRKQVEEITFTAVDKMMSLRRSVDLKTTKLFEYYPTAEALNALELLYGEAISIADLDGAEAEQQREAKKRLNTSKLAKAANESSSQSVASASQISAAAKREEEEERNRRAKSIRCAPLDCSNPQYERWCLQKAAEQPRDFLAEQRELRRQAWENMLHRNDEKTNHLASTLTATFGEEKSAKIYIYSNQALNYKVHTYDTLRKELGKSKNATFTYNKDFNSQTVSTYIPPPPAAKDSEWLTPSGFLYPKPRTRKELIRHPDKPSDARIEDLKEPFDSGNVPPPPDAETLALTKLEAGYNTRFRPSMDFGNLEAPEFVRPFELKNIGNKKRLPRGELAAGTELNPDFFRSVHLGGDDAVRQLEEAIAKEKQDWKDKVVVEHTDFKVGGYKIRDKPIQADKGSDILKSDAKTNALKYIREHKSASGKDLAYHTTDYKSLVNGEEPYVPNQLGKILLRGVEETKFVTTGEIPEGTNGRPKDFALFIKSDENAPRLQKVLAKKQHPPLDKTTHECTGPRWEGVK